MGENEEVGAGILRLVAALENEGSATSQGQEGVALCFLCGPLTKASEEVKLLSKEKDNEKLVILLRALLVSHKDEEEILRRLEDLPVSVCGDCDKSLDTLVDLNQQLEDVRLQFCGLRRQVGRQMILWSLGRTQKSYKDWLADVKSVEDVFPSDAPKRLRNVANGTDKVVKVEEEESDFDMIPGDVKVETESVDERLETRGNSGGVTAKGSTRKLRKGASEKDVSLSSMKTCRVVLERLREVPGTNSRPATPRKRRISTNESETKKSSNEQQRTNRLAGKGEGSAYEEESPEQVTPIQDGLGDGSCDLSSTTKRPRRAVAMKKRNSNADGSLKRRSNFTRKPLKISLCVKVPNKSSDGIHYYRRCKFCPKVFSNYFGVRRHCYVDHKAEYVKDLPFACHVCCRLFPAPNTLEDHMKQQHESLRCPTCHKYFHSQHNLTRHMRIHTGEKPYACDVCKQKFTLKQQAQEHMVTHTGVKPFVCSCGHGFTRRANMTSHKTSMGHS